jgi:hypothetical protein
MQKYLVLSLLFLAYSYAQSQIDLGITWQKNVETKIITSKISNDGKFVYVTNPGWNTIRKMSLETGEYISAFDNTNYIAKDDIQRLFLSSDGTKLISQSWNTVCIWDVVNEKVVKEIYFDSSKGTENGIYHINVSSNGKILAVNFVKSLTLPNGYQSYILIYDLEQNKEISRNPMPDNGTLAEVCLSSDLMLLAVGYNYISQTFPSKIYAQKVCLLNAENGKLIKEIDKFDNVYFTDEFRKIQFSQNNNLIGYSTKYQNSARIFDINKNKIIVKNINSGAVISEILSNNTNYLINYFNYRLELWGLENKINTFHIWPECLDTKLVNGKTKVFIYSEGVVYILDEKTLGIESELNQINSNVLYNNQNNILKIQNMPYNTKSINITDLVGKNLYVENIQNQLTSEKIININLQNGLYIVNIKMNSQDLVYKFQVRR